MPSKTPSDRTFSVAIEKINLIGRDSMCNELWSVASGHGSAGPSTARAALPSLFRLQNVDAFLWAFSLLKKPTRLEKDMLWQLVGTRQDAPLQLLIDNVRKPYEYDDLIIIADRIASTRGSTAVKEIINDKLANAVGRNRRSLQRLRKEYGG